MSKLSEALFAGNRELSESQVTEAVRNFTFETKDGETYDIPAATADDAITSFHRRFPVIQNEDIIAFYDESDIHYCPISGEELDEFLDVGAPNINLNLDASGQSVGILGGKGGDADDDDEVDEGLVGDVAGGIGNAVDRIGKKLPIIGGLFEGTEDGFSVGDKVYYVDDDPKVPGEIVEIHEDGTCDVVVNDNSGDIVNVDMKMLDYWDDSQMECTMTEGCRINYEDDLVKVYDGNKVIYQGIEDYEPMRDEPWKWNAKDECYYLNQDGKTYKKVCFESKSTEDTVRKSNDKKLRESTNDYHPPVGPDSVIPDSYMYDYRNKLLVFKPEALAKDYRYEEFQYFYATGGFGCLPEENGTKFSRVFGKFIYDNYSQGFSRNDFYGIADESKLPDWVRSKMNGKITEDTVRKSNGKWTNRGDDGKEHGEFDTKAEADAQRKAMYASGWKGESFSPDMSRESLMDAADDLFSQAWLRYGFDDEAHEILDKNNASKDDSDPNEGYFITMSNEDIVNMINDLNSLLKSKGVKIESKKRVNEALDADGFDMLMDEIRKHNISIEDLEHAIEVIKDEEREANEVALKGLSDILNRLDSKLEIMSHPYDNVPKFPDGNYGREAWISNDPDQYLGYIVGISGDYNDRSDTIQVYLYDNDERFKEMGKDFNIKDADKAVEIANKLVNEINADMDPGEVEAIGLKYLGR